MHMGTGNPRKEIYDYAAQFSDAPGGALSALTSLNPDASLDEKIVAHAAFEMALIEAFIESFHSSRTPDEKLMGWAAGQLLDRFPSFLNQHELDDSPIFKELRSDYLEWRSEYIAENSLGKSLTYPLGKSEGDPIEWAHEDIFNKRIGIPLTKDVYGVSQFSPTIVRLDIKKSSDFVKALGGRPVLGRKYSSKNMDAMLTEDKASEGNGGFPFSKFVKISEDNSVYPVPSQIDKLVRDDWLITPAERYSKRDVKSKIPTSAKSFSGMDVPQNSTKSGYHQVVNYIDSLNLPQDARDFIVSRVTSMIKDVADYYRKGPGVKVYKLNF